LLFGERRAIGIRAKYQSNDANWLARRVIPRTIIRPFSSRLADRFMKKSKVALAFCLLLQAFPLYAQVALKSDTPSLLFWNPEQQSTGYRSIEKLYKVVTVKRGVKVHPLPKAPKQL
jgi:hypothetical protein